MQEMAIESFSEYVRALSLFYSQNKKSRTLGRPKTKDDEQDDADNIEMYQNPDPNTRSMYSYNELEAWYQTQGEEMPPRDQLVIHKEYVGKD